MRAVRAVHFFSSKLVTGCSADHARGRRLHPAPGARAVCRALLSNRALWLSRGGATSFGLQVTKLDTLAGLAIKYNITVRVVGVLRCLLDLAAPRARMPAAGQQGRVAATQASCLISSG